MQIISGGQGGVATRAQMLAGLGTIIFCVCVSWSLGALKLNSFGWAVERYPFIHGGTIYLNAKKKSISIQTQVVNPVSKP